MLANATDLVTWEFSVGICRGANMVQFGQRIEEMSTLCYSELASNRLT